MSAKTDKVINSTVLNAVHFTLQGKVGVGKSLVSAMLAQYFQSVEGCDVKCIDTDPAIAPLHLRTLLFFDIE